MSQAIASLGTPALLVPRRILSISSATSGVQCNTLAAVNIWHSDSCGGARWRRRALPASPTDLPSAFQCTLCGRARTIHHSCASFSGRLFRRLLSVSLLSGVFYFQCRVWWAQWGSVWAHRWQRLATRRATAEDAMPTRRRQCVRGSACASSSTTWAWFGPQSIA